MANSSAAAQSIDRSVGDANIALRRSRPRSSLRCTVKPSGTVISALLIACRVSIGTAVRAFLAAPLGGISGTGGT